MSGCIFCKVIVGEIPSTKVYEDDTILAILDVTPVNPGHVLVIPKEHSEDILSMSDDLYSQCMIVAKRIGGALIKSGLAEAFNIGVNTRPASGQLVFHTHIHVMPRKKKDGYQLWHGKAYSSEKEKEKVGSVLRDALL